MNDLVPATDNPYQLTGFDFSTLDPLSTVHEITLMRSILAKAVASDAPPIVISQLATCIGRLSKDFAMQSVRNHKMVHADKVREYLKDVCGKLALAFSDVPDWEQRIDGVITAMAQPENSQRQINDLCSR